MTLSDDRRLLLERLILQTAPVTNGNTSATGARIEPASYGQRRLWFLDQLQQIEVPYTLHAVQRLTFDVKPVLLEQAINEIIKRHEILRTTFLLQEEEPVQRISDHVTVPLHCVDLLDLPADERQPEALRQMGITIARRFDMERGPLLRTELYRLDLQEWLFLLTVHHIVFDWPSFQIFFNELETVYGSFISQRPSTLPKLNAQYADFAREQRSKLTEQRIEEEVNFWREELAGVPILNLPTDRMRAQTSNFRGERKQVMIPPELVMRLQQRALSEKVTLFTILLASFSATLARICGQDDFAVGLPITGRDTVERQDSIGFYVDTVVVRMRLQGELSTDELIKRARAALNRSLQHRVLPFELLVQHLQPVRDLGVNPYFQIGFQLMQHRVAPEESTSLDIARSSVMFDLCLDLWMQGKGISGTLQFNTDLLDAPTVDLIISTFARSLEWIVEPQRDLNALDFGLNEHSAQGSLLKGEMLNVPEHSCVQLLASITQEHPDRPALQAGDDVLSYRELIARVTQFSSSLMRRGVTPGSLVALDMIRSLDLICMQLAVMHCGAAFTCFDPAWPPARREQILQDAHPALYIDPTELRSLKEESDVVPLPTAPTSDDVAYMIFTSGSSGPPKGVVIEHGGLLNVAHAQRRVFGLTPGRRVAQLSSSTFDASIFETVLALGSGATLVIAPPEILAGEELAQFISQNHIDTVVIPPTVLATVEAAACPSLRLICVAGESCPSDLLQRWGEGREFWNLYGPTETTIWATYGRRPVGSKVSIGRPIANLTTAVVDASLRIVPVGVAGELCVMGPGLARGYLGRPELTGQRFIEQVSTFARRMYRTGDLVRQTYSGELVFLGRVDRQIKVRGFRIEPEEVEAVLRSHPHVSDAVVDAVSIGGSELTLIAYLQCTNDAADVIEECRRLIKKQLPLYMSPTSFIALDRFPRTASGKIDLKALPVPNEMALSGSDYVEPATPTEHRVAELMMHTLHSSRIGAAHDFFHIGGHSLAAAQLVARIRTLFKVELTIRDIFLYSKVSELAQRIEELQQVGVSAAELDEVPLTRLPRTADVLQSRA